jgi:hypothetical protein
MGSEETDVCKDYHGGAATSAAAFETTPAPVRKTQRVRVLEYITAHKLCQCEDVENALQISHQSASARIADLLRDGRLVDTGLTAKTKAGKTARLVAVMV